MSADDENHGRRPTFARFQKILEDTPVVLRLSALTATPLFIILTLAVSDYFVQHKQLAELRDSGKHPDFAAHLAPLISALHHEQDLSLRVNRNHSRLVYARSHTDHEVELLESYYYHNAKVLNLPGFLTNLGEQNLVHVRSIIDSGTADANDIILGYNQQRTGLVHQAFMAVKGSSRHNEELDSEMVALLTLSFGGAFARVEQACITAKLAEPATEHGRHEDEELTKEWQHYKVMRELYMDDIFSMASPKHEKELFDGVVNSRAWQDVLDMTHDLDTGYWTSANAQQVAQTFQFHQWEERHIAIMDDGLKIVQTISDDIMNTLKEVEDDIMDNTTVDIILISFVAFFLCLLLIAALLHRRNADYETKQRANLVVMLENLNRVAEYGDHIGFFDLTVPQVAKGRRLTEQERVLMQCEGALKTVAPAVTPALFSERYVTPRTTDGKKQPCTMELMMNCLAPHHAATNQSRRTLVSAQDTNASRAITQMQQRASLAMNVRKATILTVNLTFLNDIVTDVRDVGDVASMMFGLKNVDNNLPKFVRTIEQVVVQNGGIVHRLCGDRMVCAWNVPNDCSERHQVAGCRAALQVTPKLRQLKNFERMYIACAVTSGDVHVGICGFEPYQKKVVTEDDEEEEEEEEEPSQFDSSCSLLKSGFKSFEFFGPCVTHGSRVAYFQKLHSTATAVLCDEQVTAAVQERDFAVKPLELVRVNRGDTEVIERIYEVVGVRLGRAAESEIRLARYCAAFKLFEHRKLKEAGKAFRGYTKQYGYDSSVERLQALVNDRKSVDDAQADEKRYIA